MADEPVEAARPPVTVITGASRGIGLALAHEFAKAGHKLVIAASGAEGLEEAAAALEQTHGVEVRSQACDLSTAEGCEILDNAVEAAGLEVDYLVNNAGAGYCAPFQEGARVRLTRILDLNVTALTDLTGRYLPGMIARRRGGVLNVASLAGYAPGPHQAVYTASKAYVMSFTEALAAEVRGSGVKMAVLAPGAVATEFHRRAGAEHCYYLRFLGAMSPETVARIGHANFMCGQTVIIPGWTNMLAALTMRLMPHGLVVPFTGWLLKRREAPDDERKED